MHIHILTMIQKGRIPDWKMTMFYLKNVLLKLDFQGEGNLYANFLFYNLSFSLKCLLFQFFSRGIRMHIPIRTGVQKGNIRG